MSSRRKVFVAAGLVAAIAFLWTCQSELQNRADASDQMRVTAPAFEVDPFWPDPLPNDWLLGNAIGVHVDAQDRIWMIHRSSASLTGGENGAERDPPTGECCVGAPPVLAFDQEGNLLKSWGGEPGEDYQGYEWPESNHGIFVDHNGFVWIGGNGGGDAHVLKLTEDGDVVAQFGEADARANDMDGFTADSHDESSFGRVADVFVDSLENETYLADGYLNKRVAVIDAESGDMQRYWGAYGNEPDDDFDFGPRGENQEPAQQFRGPVHCVHITSDRQLYVCDRQSNRVQVFTPEGEFVQEALYQPETLGEGSTWDVAFSTDPDQQYMYVADGRNMELRVVDRESMDELYSFGQGGRYPGMWFGLHSIATDSEGNLYTTETYEGKRIQKFVYMGERQVPGGEGGVPWPTDQ